MNAKELLIEAAHEIKQLRRVNEILSAKVDMIELFDRVLHTQPAYKSQAMSEDIVWKINKFTSEFELPAQ
jgi:hypothetical protein